MPNVAVAGYTKVPVVAADLLQIRYDRLNASGSSTQITVQFEIKDSVGGVRGTTTISQQTTAYPVSLAAVLAACNAANGTA
jgi:hypothetical protein